MMSGPAPVAASISWRINAERAALLGWSRAILLQLAHPLVAAGVDEHSSFRGGPFAAATRLHHTVRAMLSLTFGTASMREETLEGIRTIHRRVRGRLRETAGRFPAGTPYSAEDPDLLLWVHATLVDSLPLVYEQVVRPLSAAERDAYCGEAASIAIALGAREGDVPRTWTALRAYMDAMLSSDAIAVSSQAHVLADAVLAPPLARLVWPAAWANRLVTTTLLPSRVRELYGLALSTAAERRGHAVLRAVAVSRRIAPDVLSLWSESRSPPG